MQNTIDTVYICDWLPPDFGAVGQYSLQFAREMAASGQSVVLVGLTSSRETLETETYASTGGILAVLRLNTPKYDKSNLIKRLWWTLRTNSRILSRSWPYLRRTRRIVFTGSPPLFLHWVIPANLRLRKRTVYRITDFHPECRIAERGSTGPLERTLLWLTWFWRHRVHEFEVLGEDQASRLTDGGIEPTRIVRKPDPAPVVISPGTRPMSRPQGAGDHALLLYSGNWGVAHDTDTFVQAYERHHRAHSSPAVLWLNAVGQRADLVESELRSRDLPVLRSRPVPLDMLPSLLVTPDAHLVTLADSFVGYVLPSKIHGCVASGKPTLFIGSERSDVHRIGSDGLGANFFRIDVGNVDGATRALAWMAERRTPPAGAPDNRSTPSQRPAPAIEFP